MIGRHVRVLHSARGRTSRVASIFASLGAATSASQYLNIASSSGLQQAVDQMNQDFINVGNALPGS